MWVLPILGYIGLLLGFAFLTLAIASGLYYLSELVEEHTVFAKKFLSRLIYGVVVFQLLLALVDGLPWFLSLISVASQVIYLQNLRHFPIVRLTDPIFLLSCTLVLLNHYLWFRHFSSPLPRSNAASSYYGTDFHANLPSFTEIASFFFLQIWLVPFSLFVSLSASENVLPSMGSEYATNPTSPLAGGVSGESRSSGAMGLGSAGGFLHPRSGGDMTNLGERSPSQLRNGSLGLDAERKRGGAKGMVRVAVDGVREWVSENGEVLGLWKGDRTRRW